MSQKYDICIVHKNERCHWLAKEMASRGLRVALVDIAQPKESWPPEDCEGPFGVLKSPQLSASQWSLLTDSRVIRESEKGFVVWESSFGPIELKGPLYNFHKSVHPELSLAEEYFRESDMAKPEVVEQYNQKVQQKTFDQNWPIQLAHNFACTEYFLNADSIQSKRPYPLYYNYIVRRPSHREYAESLDSLEASGVHVFRKATINDLSVDKKAILGAEVSTHNFSQFIQAEYWVWSLSDLETQYHFPKLYSTLYLGEPVQPQWAWVRYRMKLESKLCINEIPSQCLLIDDIYAPWAHANFIQCIRSDVHNEFDFWVRIPEVERFRREYLEEMREKILVHLAKKLPELQMLNYYMPQEYYYASAELGPALYSIYEGKSTSQSSSNLALKNVKFDGPQSWSRHDEVYRLLFQSKFLKNWLEDREKRKKNLSPTSLGSHSPTPS